ncbi:spore protease YyaC [Paenibacillus eucommiae]|uniref:Sporulation protein YyaC n=1 Tax=Paenibacillus eucommiae TaxID=1355755 RepID=A0ABS4IWI3_9BACL|nr:spore protease YyaC [Paenibacillus eucommiae]MBP1990884.1 putative sporulation protein YyaC [Paenibacillus eucommiae]
MLTEGNAPRERYWKKIKGGQLPAFLDTVAQESGRAAGPVVFVCIGTDRSSGDALGPLVGTLLQEAGYPHVIGTLEAPCDASNLPQRLLEIPQGATIIAIDACLGQHASVGLFQVSNQPVYPGKSVGKMLPQVGDYTIAAIVNASGPKQYAILQTTSLHLVMKMSKEIAEAVKQVFL